jgi:hypothetical protein
MCSARLTLVALALLVAGCTHTFGLDQVGLDDDHDGVLDDADNCPDDYNPRQQDFDRDGVGDHCSVCMAPNGRDDDADGLDDACDACVGPGELDRDVGDDGIDDGCEPCPEATGQDLDEDGIDDACDSCLRGPPLDEDGDGVANACDACPSRPDPLQEHAGDTDRLGDACDPDTDPLGASQIKTLQTHRLFDGFDGMPAAWLLNDVPASGGESHLPALAQMVPSARFTHSFLLEASVRFAALAKDASFAMFVEGNAFCPNIVNCYASATCTLTSDGNVRLLSYTGEEFTSTETLDVTDGVRMWFRSSTSSRSPNGGMTQLCVGVDVHGVTATAVQDEVPAPIEGLQYLATLTAGAQPVDLRYVWLVSN